MIDSERIVTAYINKQKGKYDIPQELEDIMRIDTKDLLDCIINEIKTNGIVTVDVPALGLFDSEGLPVTGQATGTGSIS